MFLLQHRSLLPVTMPAPELGAKLSRTSALSKTNRIIIASADVAYGEGPGSGRRQAPSLWLSQSRAPGPSDKFDLISAAEMYRKFPEWVHSSSPASIEDREPAGLSVLHTPDNGPLSGLRRRPSPSMNRKAATTALPYPCSGPVASDLKRDLAAKKRIIV